MPDESAILNHGDGAWMAVARDPQTHAAALSASSYRIRWSSSSRSARVRQLSPPPPEVHAIDAGTNPRTSASGDSKPRGPGPASSTRGSNRGARARWASASCVWRASRCVLLRNRLPEPCVFATISGHATPSNGQRRATQTSSSEQGARATRRRRSTTSEPASVDLLGVGVCAQPAWSKRAIRPTTPPQQRPERNLRHDEATESPAQRPCPGPTA